ncbi:DUF1996 domain-containing protein [Mycena indigotica]|uniref:DUF1996 domain-containing protein n=1 Tax=Mycena indigotica TaxID=2126181 RepID=A0A8H6WH07_9AGAR|nr:DUF1996 domain-containing protein [Mycena indigotica]KAF7312009.1 DUF1996 domain-containing protein [Mycena indigotica]
MARALLGLLLSATALSGVNSYFLFGMTNVITTERIDPIVNPGKVSGHVHDILGGSNFRVSTNTSFLRQSECTTSPIKEDKSNYWVPTLYFHWKNGSFSSVSGGSVICTPYYLFSKTPGATTPFPDNFRMLSGTPTLRSYNPNDFAQQAVTFLCLNYSGNTTRHNELPSKVCPSGIRAQVNFPSCWDGVNTDSPDHKSHVAYLSEGPDAGTCSDKRFPKTLPRIFIEMYLDTGSWDKYRDQAMNPDQPYVYAMGDPTGYGYHADFLNGWDAGVLQNVVDKCHCNDFGDPTCCADQGLFKYVQGGHCRITKGVDEITTGTLASLPGNNPVVGAGQTVENLPAPVTPALISPVFAYTGESPGPSQTGSPVGPATTHAPTSGGSSAGSSSSSSGSSGAVSAPPANGGSSSKSNSSSGTSVSSTANGSKSHSRGGSSSPTSSKPGPSAYASPLVGAKLGSNWKSPSGGGSWSRAKSSKSGSPKGSSSTSDCGLSSSSAFPQVKSDTPAKSASGSSNSSWKPPACKPKPKARRSVAAGVQAHSRRRRFTTP